MRLAYACDMWYNFAQSPFDDTAWPGGKHMWTFSEDHDDLIDHLRANIDRMYQDRVRRASWMDVQHTHTWRPPTDVFETDEAVVVRIEVAGMSQSDFHISTNERLLVITGFRNDPSPKVAYHQLEVRYGEFRVEVFLHWLIDHTRVQATYESGFLMVTLPRTQPRQIPVVDVDS